MNDSVQKIWFEFNRDLKGFILTKVKDEEIANDILQDVFIKIIENSDKISNAKSAQHYIFGIARNATIDHFRNSNKKTVLAKESASFSDEESESLNDIIADCCIRPFIEQLPDIYRQALLKTQFEGVPQKELGRLLNISNSGAKSRVQRGKDKLKELILSCCNLHNDTYGNLQLSDTKNCNCP